MAAALAHLPGRRMALEPRTPTTATEPPTEALDPDHARQPGTREPAHHMEAVAHPNSAVSMPLLLDPEHPLGVVVMVEAAAVASAAAQELGTAHRPGLVVHLL